MLHHILYRYRGLSVACTIAAASMSCTDGSGPTGPDNSVTTVEVAAPSASLMVGETFQLAAVARNAAGAFAVAGQVTWTSSNNSVATVSPNGLVTAVETGAAQISATHEGRTGSARVTVVTTELIQSIDQYADGTLAFTSTRGGAFDVFTAGPSGLTRVTANPDHEQFDGWSPDGSRLAFIRFPVNAGVFTSHVINSDGTNDIVVASGLVQWSPNWTKRNAFRDGQLVVTNADGSGAVVVSPPVGDTIFGGGGRPMEPGLPSGTRRRAVFSLTSTLSTPTVRDSATSPIRPTSRKTMPTGPPMARGWRSLDITTRTMSAARSTWSAPMMVR